MEHGLVCKIISRTAFNVCFQFYLGRYSLEMFLHSMQLVNMRRACFGTPPSNTEDDSFFGNHLMDD